MDADLVGVVEAGYRAAEDDEAWLRGVLLAAQEELDDGLGLVGYFVDASDLSLVRVGSAVVVGGPPGWREAYVQIAAALQSCADEQRVLGVLGPTRLAAQIYTRSHSVVTATEVAGRAGWSSSPAVRRWLHPLGVEDVLAVKTMDLDRRGVVIGALRQHAERPSRELRWRWSRVAAHLSAGLRLRRRLALRLHPTLDDAEAIFETGGRLVHATGVAAEPSMRQALRAMAISIDHARGPGRHDPEEALSLWTALTCGRWTLIDGFERDGRRYLVAARNEPQVARVLALAPRERQVAACAAVGHANKFIAYELGVSPPTVSAHLASAMSKLGITSRAELARVFAMASHSGPGFVDEPSSELRVASDELPSPPRADQLTGAQRAIVKRVAAGESNAQIAARQGIAERTVANHLANIFRKVGVGSRAALSAWNEGALAAPA